ncbi:MAG: hypothetical protein Q7S10_00565 [bacterium]|nr:hypothetical protein [bacterium]
MEKTAKLSLGTTKGLWFSFARAVKRIYWWLGVHAFLVLLLLLLASISFGAHLFYKYAFLMNNSNEAEVSIPTKFKESAYRSVLQEWQQREEASNSIPLKEYKDPFK